ncbi:hypothetical protein DLM77_21275 [Leptospira yasudae]|uniref:Uncharacterized protein n=1 Tax=Leptospira yasudae TaxID=2202201 RepID=A0ABX9LXA4_9LEPT|nr:hypothetical protein DLM77_21275 [Leptospira yasudae]
MKEISELLIRKSWKQDNLMSYSMVKNNNSFELFFDTSNQVEMYLNGKRIAECFFRDMKELENFIEKCVS